MNDERSDDQIPSDDLEIDICEQCKQKPCVCPKDENESKDDQTTSEEESKSEAKRPKISWI